MVTYINNGNIGNGNGCKIHFMQDALDIFKQKYLIDHGMRTSFNISEMEIFTDNELKSIGSMLHMIIYHSNSHLSIRLPITLITAIAKRSPNILELEYLAKEEYGDTFKNICNYKYDVKTIKSFGYDSYYQCLKNLCKYYENDDETNSKVRNISRQIADGFMDYQNISNLREMNIPTIDYYLSGNYCIDRKKLIKNLKVGMYNKNQNKKNEQKIKKCTKVFKK
nr:KilA-N domain-containing protein [Mimivirus sp.]